MRDTSPYSYRILLLASVAGIALGGGAEAASYDNTTPVAGAAPLYTLNTGDSLANSSSITANSGTAAAVVVNGLSAASITNSGTIQSTLSNGTAVSVISGASVGTISITSGGVLAAETSSGQAISDAGGIAAFTNSGVVQADGEYGVAVSIASSGSAGTFATRQAERSKGTAPSARRWR